MGKEVINVKKIVLSIGSILFVSALLAGGTGAFLNSKNTSTGNTFATGIIDLKIDNESYVTDNDGHLVFSPSTSWALSSLTGKLFFNFPDIKPGDVGEDTISLHVSNNNAWACMKIALTGTPENGLSDPEALVDNTTGLNDGELQKALNFAFWADDGDNVYEANEKVFVKGAAKDIFNGQAWALSDSATNIWGNTIAPIPAESTRYIAKAWCFGDMAKTPLTQDNLGKTGTNGPLVRGTGFTCNGEPLGNILQTDGITADVSFVAVQSRNNAQFICGQGSPDPEPETVTLLFDNFETCRVDHDMEYMDDALWTQFGGVQGAQGQTGKAVDLNADNNSSAPNNTESITSISLDLSIYHNINLSYDRMTDDNAGAVNPQSFKVEYSVNGGSTWSTLETVAGETPWTNKSFSLSPSADHVASMKLRFTLTGTNASNHAFLDNVTVTGVTP